MNVRPSGRVLGIAATALLAIGVAARVALAADAMPPAANAMLPAPDAMPPAPDYTQADAWVRRPAADAGVRAGASAATPPAGAAARARAAAFYVHHTTYDGRERLNAAYDDPALVRGVDAVVLGQGSTLDACCDVWAPRYRQASMAALATGMAPYDRAYVDVLAAFREFLAHNAGRPIVLLGHSQGALHVQRLVTEVIDRDPVLAKRLVVAYVVGIPVPTALYAKTLTRVRPCERSTQTGCLAVWATYSASSPAVGPWRERARTRYADLMAQAGDRGLQCTNPLNWRADGTPAAAALNLGATVVDRETGRLMPPVAGGWGAHCDDGALILDGKPTAPFVPMQLGPGNWHLADVALFHANVSRNAAERVAAWWQQRRGGG